MKRMPSIKAVMTPFPYSVEATASLASAREFMQEHGIRHLPVTHDGQLAGVISDRDIKLVLGPDFAYMDPDTTTIGEAMIRESYMVDLDTRLDEVLTHMAGHHLGSAIVTRRGKLVGVFTVTDACRHFAEFLQEQVRRAGGDDAA